LKLPDRFKTALLAGGVLLTGGSLALTYRTDLAADEVDKEYTNQESEFTELGENKIHYRDTGTGDNLVLLHGVASSLHTWSAWADNLKDYFRLIRPDLPGFGLTGPRADSDYSLTSYDTFLNRFFDAVNLNEFSLVGNSFGGYLALRYALKHPDRVNKIILLNTMELEKGWPFPLKIGQYPILNQLNNFTPKTLIRNLLTYLYGNPDRVSEDLVERYYKLLRREGNRQAIVNFVKETMNNSSFNIVKRLGELATPVLIQWGLKDPWFPVSHAEVLRENLNDVSLVTYLAAGHMPMEEIPEQTAQDAKSFLTP
jgi:pimeloyl-ACP methyl ester carboxylesterase